MPVNILSIILVSLLEIVALIVIVRLWMRRRAKLLPRFIWSVVLLVPFFGLLVYLFLHEEPEAHPYITRDSGWNIDGNSGGGDSGHSGH